MPPRDSREPRGAAARVCGLVGVSRACQGDAGQGYEMNKAALFGRGLAFAVVAAYSGGVKRRDRIHGWCCVFKGLAGKRAG